MVLQNIKVIKPFCKYPMSSCPGDPLQQTEHRSTCAVFVQAAFSKMAEQKWRKIGP